MREQLLRGRIDDFERAALNQRWSVLTAIRVQLGESRARAARRPDARRTSRTCGCARAGASATSASARRPSSRTACASSTGATRRSRGSSTATSRARSTRRRSAGARSSARSWRAAPWRSAAARSRASTRRRGASSPTASGAWVQIASEAPRLAGGEGAALRVHAAATERRAPARHRPHGRGAPRRQAPAGHRRPDRPGAVRADHAALGRLRRDPRHRGLGQDHGGAAPHRVPRLRRPGDRLLADAVPGVLAGAARLRLPRAARRSASRACRCARCATGRRSSGAGSSRGCRRRPREDTPASVQRLKLHPALLVALERQVARNPGARDGGAGDRRLDQRALEPGAPRRGARASGRTTRRRRASSSTPRAGAGGAPRSCSRGSRATPSQDAELDPEDDALLLRAWQLRVGPLPGAEGGPLRYRHVAIDEVQDFAAVEVRVLLDCLDDRRSLTLAGDTQQQHRAGLGLHLVERLLRATSGSKAPRSTRCR